jgi:tRNA pseudouridine55 synthase
MPVSTRHELAGLLFVDKPAGMSSHDVVGVVRRAVRHRRVGHAGTLDPFATGLLVLAVGKVTRLLPYIGGEPKVYEATFAFGSETDTDDRTGTVIRSAPCPSPDALLDPHAPSRLAAERQLTGAIEQVPPAFSAKHVDGQRAYDLARRGREIVLKPVPIVVHQWEWLGATSSSLTVRITCGGGTYIRALARDLGRLLGSAAHCDVLRRVASGAARVEDAVPLSALAPGSVAEGEVSLMSPRPLLEPIATEVLDDAQRHALRFGRRISATQPGTRAALLVDGEVVAIAERTADAQWQPRVVLLDAES